MSERTPRHLRRATNATEAKTIRRLAAAEAVFAFVRHYWKAAA
ncbi:MAG TPA: hypothetical protein VLI07_18770 [Candidatus Binatus sp.]|nr:hypothetical protein [Candidatus Binatus sp.]